MESIVSKCIEQLLDLIDHVENVGIEEWSRGFEQLLDLIDHVKNIEIEERSRRGKQRETSIAKDSYEVVNNFFTFNF